MCAARSWRNDSVFPAILACHVEQHANNTRYYQRCKIAMNTAKNPTKNFRVSSLILRRIDERMADGEFRENGTSILRASNNFHLYVSAEIIAECIYDD